MAEENISQEYRFNNTDKTRNYLLEEIDQNQQEAQKGLYDSKFY